MAIDTINGVAGYEVNKSGNVQTWIRQAGLTPAEDAFLTAARTAANASGGYQIADFGGSVTGAGATGLANDTTAYTATVKIDGTDKAVSVVGSAAQTFTTLITEINTDLGAAGTASIVNGNIKIESATENGSATSTVAITDGTLFAALTGFVSFESGVGGTLEDELKTNQTWNDQPAWNHFAGYVETYDPAAARFVVADDFTVASTSSGMTETELKDLIARVNAIQDSVRKYIK